MDIPPSDRERGRAFVEVSSNVDERQSERGRAFVEMSSNVDERQSECGRAFGVCSIAEKWESA
jgi:hypothetical protein